MNIPAYQEKPLSALVPMPQIAGQQQLQLWAWLNLWQSIIREQSLNAISEFVAQGMVPSQVIESAALDSQLYQIARMIVDAEQGIMQTWYKPDQDDVQPVPVILAFTIDSPAPSHLSPGETIDLLNPLPLPQHGEYAVIEDPDGKIFTYHVLQLPLEARLHWVELGNAIRKVSAPLLWHQFDEYHIIAADESLYQKQLQSLTIQHSLAIGATRKELFLHILLLKEAHTHLRELHTALQKTDWLQQWQEIRAMARALAHDYWYYHQQQHVHESEREHALTVDREEQEVLERPESHEKQQKKKRERRPRPASTTRRKPSDTVSVKSDLLTRRIVDALRDEKQYKRIKEQGIAFYRHELSKDAGQITISIQAQDGEGWEAIVSALNTLGDGCIDTYMAVMGMAIEQNGIERIRTPIEISPDDILAFCGKKKSNGSYRVEQRAEIIKYLKTLSQVHIVATIPTVQTRKRRGKERTEPTVFRAEGAIIDLLSFKIGEYNTITGEEMWERQSISIGPWAQMIPDLSPQTALMLRQVLAYSARNQPYQKGLGRYLSLMFRVNAKHGGTFPHDITMQALLDGAGIVPPREHGQFREAIERALDQLKRDNVIGNYWRVIEDTPEAKEINREIEERARGWFAYYLKQKWNFEPPAIIQRQYKNLLRKPSETDPETS